MNDGLKILLYTLGVFTILACVGCMLDNWYSKKSKTCNPIFCHIEIHSDRPIKDIAKEIARDKETQETQIEREVLEAVAANEWESMS